MKKYRVSIQHEFCRDVFLEAETPEEAKALATEEDYDEDDWCIGDGHATAITGAVETDDNWEEL